MYDCSMWVSMLGIIFLTRHEDLELPYTVILQTKKVFISGHNEYVIQLYDLSYILIILYDQLTYIYLCHFLKKLTSVKYIT